MEDDDRVARGLQMILTEGGYTVDWDQREGAPWISMTKNLSIF